MKMYEIAVFFFIFNFMLTLFNTHFVCGRSSEGICLFSAAWGKSHTGPIIKSEEAAQKISRTVGENQGGIIGALNWLTENVYLAIQGIGAFITLILNSTILAKNTWYDLLCYQGVSCMPGTLMWNFAAMMSGITYIVYAAALIQFATGKSMRDME